MFFMRKILVYLSPLLCLLLLVLALVISRREAVMRQTASPSPGRLRLICDAQLQDPVQAMLDAFQRRHYVQVEMVVATPGQLLSEGRGRLDGDILLTLERVPEVGLGVDAGSHGSPVELATLRPVVLASSVSAGQFREWSDLTRLGLRLALPGRRDSALARHTAVLLAVGGLGWEAAVGQAVFQSDDGAMLARAVALGKADAAVLWEPNARLYSQLAAVVLLPVDDNDLAVVCMAALASGVERPEQLLLKRFLRGALAAEIFLEYSYGLPAASRH